MVCSNFCRAGPGSRIKKKALNVWMACWAPFISFIWRRSVYRSSQVRYQGGGWNWGLPGIHRYLGIGVALEVLGTIALTKAIKKSNDQ